MAVLTNEGGSKRNGHWPYIMAKVGMDESYAFKEFDTLDGLKMIPFADFNIKINR